MKNLKKYLFFLIEKVNKILIEILKIEILFYKVITDFKNIDF